MKKGWINFEKTAIERKNFNQKKEKTRGFSTLDFLLHRLLKLEKCYIHLSSFFFRLSRNESAKKDIL